MTRCPGPLAAITVLLLAACAPSVPRDQLQRANAGYQVVMAASGPLLSDLAIAERRNFAARASDADSLRDDDLVAFVTFEPGRASYYGAIG